MAIFHAPIKSAMYMANKMNTVWMEWFRAVGGIASNFINVIISSPADNEVLAYDTAATGWINQTPADANLCDLTTPQTLAGPKTLTAPVCTSPVVNIGIFGTAVATTVDDPGSDTIIVSEQGIREALAAMSLLGFSDIRACRPYATGDDVAAYVPGEVTMENAAGTRVRLSMPAGITSTIVGKTASKMLYFYVAIPGAGTTIAVGDITSSETKPTDQGARGLMDAAGNLKYIGSVPVDAASDFYVTYICSTGEILYDSAPDMGAEQHAGFVDVDVSAYAPSIIHAMVRVVSDSNVNCILKARMNGHVGTGTPWQITAQAARAQYYECCLDANGIYELDTNNVNTTANYIIGYTEWR